MFAATPPSLMVCSAAKTVAATVAVASQPSFASKLVSNLPALHVTAVHPEAT